MYIGTCTHDVCMCVSFTWKQAEILPIERPSHGVCVTPWAKPSDDEGMLLHKK